jgi:hypothetical protein
LAVFRAVGGMLCLFWLALSCAYGETEEELTPAETALLRTFLSSSSTFRTRDTLRVIAARAEDNLWLQTLREDSRQRLANLVPDLESRLAIGRAKRQEFFNKVIADAESEVRAAGFSLDPANELLTNYRQQVARYSRQKPRPPPWAAAQAELLTRRRFAVVFERLLREYHTAIVAQAPTDAGEPGDAATETDAKPKALPLPLQLPRERWPIEATRYYNFQIDRMTEVPRQSSLAVLPDAKYRGWLTWAVKFTSEQLSAIAALQSQNDYYRAAYLQNIRDTRYAVLRELQKELETKFIAANQQPALQRLLQTTSQLQAQKLAQAETQAFGGPSRIGGNYSQAVDPKLEWLVDLDWYLHGEYAGPPRGRFYHSHVDRTLNPGVYWRRQWQSVKKVVRSLAFGTTIAAMTIGTAVGLSVTAKSLGLVSPDIYYSPMPDSIDTDSLSGRAATGNMHSPERRIFTIIEGSEDNLELPVIEDIDDSLTHYPTPNSDSNLVIESEVSFHPIRGTYVPLPKAPQRTISHVAVRRNGYKLFADEFDVVQSAKGFSFIRLQKPDWIPSVWSSNVSYVIYYSRDPTVKPAPPSPPVVTPEELVRIRERFNDGEMRGEVLQGLTNLEGTPHLNLGHLNSVIKTHSYYSFVPGVVRKKFFSQNYVSHFSDFRDAKENFCPDCDVAGEMVHSMTTDIQSAQRDWKFEIRPSIHLIESSRYFRQGGRHGRLYGWKVGYSEPLILDATPNRLDPRSDDEVNAFMRQMEQEEAQRQQDTAEQERLGETAYIRRRMSDEPELQPGEGILPDPDLEDPMIARQVAAKLRKALLLASIVTETSERETRNKQRDQWLEQLNDSLSGLRQEVEALGLRVAPYTGSPHSTAFQFGMALLTFVESGDFKPLDRLFAKMGVQLSPTTNPELLSAAFKSLEQSVRERVTAARALRALSPRAKAMLLVADSSLDVLKLLALHPWSSRESTNRNEVRRSCHESLLVLSKLAAN